MFSRLTGMLPIAASDLATRWDWLYDFLIGLSIFFTILVLGAMIYFAVVYRRRPGLRTKYITDHHALELLWTAIPTVLLMGIFVWGYAIYSDMVQPPANAMEIRVIGQQWKWNFQYEDGRITTGKFYAPLNTPVKLITTSQDVLHGFFIPNFRIKTDVVPGMYTSVWFEAKVPGRHQVYCTAYCGGAGDQMGHSLMLADAIILTEAQWADFKKGKEIGPIADAGTDVIRTAQAAPAAPALSMVEQGKRLFDTKACASCHTQGDDVTNGPALKGLFGSKVALEGGRSVTADDNYIREAIENPAAKIRKGYRAGQMPPYQGQLSESDLAALIAYIRSLK